jgi:hypothetical protein
VVHALGVEQRGAALDAVDLVAFFKQELGEVGTVLAGNPGNQGLMPVMSARFMGGKSLNV